LTLEHPNYQFVAARLLLFAVRKQLFGRIHDCPTVKQQVERCVGRGVYDSEILSLYSDEEFDKLQSFIDHHRDYLFTYAGLRQVVDKYLVQDRSTGALYETPQFMYLMIAATIFSKYPKETRLDYVKKYYDAISKHRINIPTPIMAGVQNTTSSICKLVFLLMLMTPSIASLAATWLLVNMLHNVQASASTQVASVASTAKIRGGEVSAYRGYPIPQKI
jgi:ribonucleoside-diphosphate reductase alpha chain